MEIFNSMETSLRKDGYYIGTFEDLFNEEEIQFLKEVTQTIIETFNTEENIECKTQHTGDHHYPFYDYKETFIHPYKDLDKIDEYMEERGYDLFQRWKQLKGNVGFSQMNKFVDLMEKIKLDIIERYYGEFGLKSENVDLGRGGTIGMYERGDKQPPHFDAGSKKTIYGIVIYLTPKEDWDSTKGGEFFINHNDTKIEPVFGNYVILDFVDSLVEHEVLELLKDYRRYTIISFPSIKEDGSEASLKFLEYKETKEVFTP